jgi:hypothetical protein
MSSTASATIEVKVTKLGDILQVPVKNFKKPLLVNMLNLPSDDFQVFDAKGFWMEPVNDAYQLENRVPPIVIVPKGESTSRRM